MNAYGAVLMQAYRIYSPPDRRLKAACEQVRCHNRQFGWESAIDEATPLGRAQAHYIRHQSGRTFTERRTAAGLTVFRFEPGQRCFDEHFTLPERFWERAVRGGHAAGARVDHSPAGWVDSMDTNLHALKEVLG